MGIFIISVAFYLYKNVCVYNKRLGKVKVAWFSLILGEPEN